MTRPPHLRFLRLNDHLLGFYDGRVPGYRFLPQDNWVDSGAISLGICSYVLIDGGEAIVYDTHVSVDHARYIRRVIEQLGARNIAVVLSHSHLDHVAGTEAFSDCEIISNKLTAERLARQKGAIEAGTYHGQPPISPLILPTTTFEGKAHLHCGGLHIDLVQFDIHSQDGTVLHLKQDDLVLAGDTIEDTVTYVAEPQRLENHLGELDRLYQLPSAKLFPNHGDPAIIETGGYNKGLIRATQQYVRNLLRSQSAPELRSQDLQTFVAGPLQAGWINYFEPYEAVHQENLRAVNPD